MNWQEKLIALYLSICKEFNDGLGMYCERMTSYADLSFNDEEVITVFLFGIMNKQKALKDIYQHANNYWRDWFPRLPIDFQLNLTRVMDSMPIVMARGNRRFKVKVAPELACPNGYCATKKLHYYGVKLHVVGIRQKGRLPMPEYIGFTPAGMHDRKAYEQLLPVLNE